MEFNHILRAATHVFFWFLTSSFICQVYGQSEVLDLKGHKTKAGLYLEISSFDNAILEYQQSIKLALEMGQQEEAIDLQITLAEVMRKTHLYEQGLDILSKIEGSEQFPLLHVRKLGRKAAIIHEQPSDYNQNELELIQSILREALQIAIQNDFGLEEAILKRELGYLQYRNADHQPGLKNLQEAAELFRKHGDEENYAGTLTKILDFHLWYEAYDLADSISAIALKLVEGKDWHAAKVDLYGTMKLQKQQQKDKFGIYYWSEKAIQSHMALQEAVYSQAMSANKVLYETAKFKNQAEESALALERQRERMRDLLLFLSILTLAIIAVLVLFIRERKLKAKLRVANEKYLMLNVESNHRIKNNLQMVTSLIKYAKKGVNSQQKESLEDISNKIQTVSALHKHLHLDVHNDFVNLGTYVQEIVRLYKHISSENFKLKESIHQVKLRSERIVYFGLLFNEMLSNTIEHSRFSKPNIFLNVEQMGSHYAFTYEDRSKRNSNDTAGTGSILIEQLITRVEGSNYQFDPATGRYQFDFYD